MHRPALFYYRFSCGSGADNGLCRCSILALLIFALLIDGGRGKILNNDKLWW